MRTSVFGSVLVMILPLFPGGSLSAQVRGLVDAGSGTMHNGSESPFGIVRIAPSLRVNTSHFFFDLDGNFAGHTEHGWQSDGHLRSAISRPILGRLQGLLGIQAGSSRTRWGKGAGGWLGEARLEVTEGSTGFALGLGSGHTFASSGTQPLSRIEAGGWSRLGRIDVGFWLKRTGLVAPGSMGTDDRSPADTLVAGVGGGERRLLQDHYTDIEASLGWSHGNLALEAGAGRRIGKAFRYTSWHVQALYQVTDRVAIVASSGQFPVDVVSGLPAGGFTTLSMRLNLRTEPPAPPSRPSSRPRSKDFSTAVAEDGTQLITVRIPQASTVEMMGDFTDWRPVLLVPGEDDTWRLRMRIAGGVHEVNLRIDGGAWTVPPGLPTVDDGLGGRVGLFSLQ